jgi:hypothetical protein
MGTFSIVIEYTNGSCLYTQWRRKNSKYTSAICHMLDDYLRIIVYSETVTINKVHGNEFHTPVSTGHVSYWTSWQLKMGLIRSPETPVEDYHSTLRNTPRRVLFSNIACCCCQSVSVFTSRKLMCCVLGVTNFVCGCSAVSDIFVCKIVVMAHNSTSGRNSCLIVLPSCKEGMTETSFRGWFVKLIRPLSAVRCECIIHGIRVETCTSLRYRLLI